MHQILAMQVDTNYLPLTTIPGAFTQGAHTNPVAVVSGVYGLAIGIGSVIAVVMIMFAGFKYMYQESMGAKSEAKGMIVNAFTGLFVMLGSYLLLNTINPDLVKFDVTLPGSKTGTLAGLNASIAQMDNAHAIASLASQQSFVLTGTIKTLGGDIQTLKDDIAGLEITTQLNPDDKKAAAELASKRSELATKVSSLQDNTIALAKTTATPIQMSTTASIDQSIIRRGLGDTDNPVNIVDSQKFADDAFNRTLDSLKSLDNQKDPAVISQIQRTETQKSVMDNEFETERMLNALLNPSNQGTAGASNQRALQTSIVATMQSNAAADGAKLTALGLTNEAAQLQARTKIRLDALCGQKNICTK